MRYCTRILVLFILLGAFTQLTAMSREQLLGNATQEIKAKLTQHQWDGAFQALQSVKLQFAKQDSAMDTWINYCKQLGKFSRDTLNEPSLAVRFFDQATQEALWRNPNSTREWDALGWLYVNKAYTFNYSFEDYKSAVNAYNLARQIIVDRLGVEDYYVAKFIYQELGNIHTRMGDYRSAEILLLRFRDICLQLEDYSDAAQAYSDLSILYVTLGKNELAIDHCRRGIGLPGIDDISKGLLFGNLATALQAVGKNSEAMAAAHQALQLFDQAPPEWRAVQMWKAGVYSLLGKVYYQKGDFKKSDENFENALAHYQKLEIANRNRSVGKLYLAWSKLLTAQQCYDEALEMTQAALATVVPALTGADYHIQPALHDLFAENTILESLSAKADILRQRYAVEGRVGDLQLALNCHELVFEVEKQLRRSYSYESSKLFNLEESHNRCEVAINLALQLWRITSDGQYKEEAFAFAERSRSILLMEAFQKTNAATIAGLPDELLVHERTLQSDVAYAEERLYNARSNQAPDTLLRRLEAEVWTMRQAYTDWIGNLEEQYPAYYNLKYNYNTADIKAIQQYLRKESGALIEYFLGRDTMYSFVITADQLEVTAKAGGDYLDSSIVAFLQSIEKYQLQGVDRMALAQTYTKAAHDLYRQLLGDIASIALPDQLTIIPDGALSLLPFDALLTEDPPVIGQFNDYPYLLKKYTVSYGYSATLQLALTQKPNSLRRFIGFAPQFNGQGGYGQLRYNISTLENIQSLIGGKVYKGTAADIDRFKEEAGDYDIVHLATHAQANTVSSDFSFVLFSNKGSGYDSLFIKDLYLLKLKAGMVVLSACQTAVGKVYTGEGVISLARGFLYAGAASVMTTLWSIDDVANRDLMTIFYKNLKKGKSKALALREAKLDYLNNSDGMLGHPVFWAAFVPIGDMKPMNNPWLNALYLGVIILVITLIGWKYSHRLNRFGILPLKLKPLLPGRQRPVTRSA